MPKRNLKHDTPVIMFRRDKNKLSPSSAFDAEMFDDLPDGVDIEVTFHLRRVLSRNNLYWQMLGNIVKATEKWANSKKLHHDLKLTLGYTTKTVNHFTGEVVVSVDSTSFDEMDEIEFKVFFKRAVQLIATDLGIDALEFYEKRYGNERKVV